MSPSAAWAVLWTCRDPTLDEEGGWERGTRVISAGSLVMDRGLEREKRRPSVLWGFGLEEYGFVLREEEPRAVG